MSTSALFCGKGALHAWLKLQHLDGGSCNMLVDATISPRWMPWQSGNLRGRHYRCACPPPTARLNHRQLQRETSLRMIFIFCFLFICIASAHANWLSGVNIRKLIARWKCGTFCCVFAQCLAFNLSCSSACWMQQEKVCERQTCSRRFFCEASVADNHLNQNNPAFYICCLSSSLCHSSWWICAQKNSHNCIYLSAHWLFVQQQMWSLSMK